MGLSTLSVVIPTYNEAHNLPKLIARLEEVLQDGNAKLIIVDDSSPDGTAQVARELEATYGNIVVQERPAKLGIGSAIRDGLRIALSIPTCNTVITMDGDLSHNPQEVISLLRESRNADLVVASRYVKGGQIVGWPLHRKVISKVTNYMCALLLRTNLHEHTNYFRAYSRRLAELVVRDATSGGFEFGIVSILIAKDHGFVIKEVPTVFENRTHGKSKLRISDMVRWCLSMVSIWLRRSSLWPWSANKQQTK
jgi:dolichol-phosphate mannosyltransferase